VTTRRAVLTFVLFGLFGLICTVASSALVAAPLTVASSGGDPFGYPEFVGFARSGETTVEFVSSSGVFVYNRPSGGSFSGGQIATGDRASMAEDGDGAAVIAYRESSTSVKVAYRANAGAAFSTATTYPASNVGPVAAGIDSHGNAVVAWSDGGIHYAGSNGATFSPAALAPLGASPTFEGKGSNPQQDHGPRAFRDDAGNIALVYRDGNHATLAHRSPAGVWNSVTLPGGTDSDDISSDADPTTGHLIIGYPAAGRFRAFVGSTASTSGAVRVNELESSSDISSVAVRPGGNEDLALWADDANKLRSASCLEDYAPAEIASKAGGGASAAVTSGSEQLAFYAGTAFDIGSRAPNGKWSTEHHSVGNFGTVAFGAGYRGEALTVFVDFPEDTAVKGISYSGPAKPQATCTSGPAPSLGSRVIAGRVSGTVLVHRPGAAAFTPLTGASAIPVGSTVDTTAGTVKLTQATTAHRRQAADFDGGVFRVTQSRRTGASTLTLTQRPTGCGAATARAARKVTRQLFGNGHGHFITRGHYGSATVRGTKWLTEERCDGTFFHVYRGVVKITDLVRHRSFSLRAGHSALVHR
jgi:hypothetical protein